ncbi:hypothetical protein LCGC14_3038470 [marine sediment metagenome]|uniref:Uncharacterized protein n=1 Tax=marine sediment metagenome TaxID=412755 RepID=A0A0F8XDK3_9ZZZZ
MTDEQMVMVVVCWRRVGCWFGERELDGEFSIRVGWWDWFWIRLGLK